MRPPAPPRRPTGAPARGDAATGRAPGTPSARSSVAVRDRSASPTVADGRTAGLPAAGSSAVTPVEPVSTRFEERMAERTRARRRVTWVRLATALVAAAVVLALAYVVLYSPLLATEAGSARVTGLGTTVDPAAVDEVLASANGIPLARLDTRALRNRVAALPAVKSAEVTRDWPRGLNVAIVSREPVAATADDAGYALLDAEGVQVGQVIQVPDGLPTVSIVQGEKSAESLSAVLAVLGALPPDLLAQVRDAGANSTDTVHLRLTDGSRVEWGSAESSALKVRVLEVLRQRPAWVYDVSAPTMPVTR
jgi:cell division protein FtsQ